MEQTAENLTQYLKMASELESSIYRQEAVIKEAEKSVSLISPQREEIPVPLDGSKLIVKPEAPKKEIITEDKVGDEVAPSLMCFVGALACGFFGLLLNNSGLYVIALLLLIPTIALFVRFLKRYKNLKAITASANKSTEAHYESSLKEYEARVLSAKEQYAADRKDYWDKVQESDRAYSIATQEAQQNYDDALAEIELLKPPLAETKALLARLYSNGWIFEKYRTMVAMATFYEYFASGRCSELTGAEGAYNLYEQELRQNLIINKLDVISSQLEDIKDNQYILYTEMKRTQELLDEVVTGVKEVNEGISAVASNTASIARSAKVAAYYSEVTAKNTEALKYIELVTQ